MNVSKKLLFAIVLIIPYASFGMEEKQKPKWDSEVYDKNSSSQYVSAMKLLGEAIKQCPIAKDASVIDIGCGVGDIAAVLAGLLPKGKILGIDPSPENIELARNKHEASHLCFKLGKAQELDYSDEYDIALFTSVLHFIPAEQQSDVLKRIYKALKPGGRLLLLDGKCSEKELPYSAQFGTVKKEKWLIKLAGTDDPKALAALREYVDGIVKNYPTQEALQAMINDAGFEGDVSFYDHVHLMANKEALMDYSRGPFSGNPKFAEMEKADQDGLLEDMADDYMEKAGVPKNDFEFRLPLLTVIATRPFE